MARESKRKKPLLYLALVVLCMALIAVCMALVKVCMAGYGTAEKDIEAEADIEEKADIEAKADIGVEADIWKKADIWEKVIAGTAEGEISLEGLSLSIFGDSLSTYDGYIPEKFSVFYPRNGNLTDVSQTWWMRLLEDMEMELCSNDSSSGSTCVGYSLSVDDPKYGCGDYRISELAGEQGKIPDVIIIYMGTNDLLSDIPLGDNDGTGWVAEGEIENFSDAYCLILDKIASNYPISRIYCCTLPPVGHWREEVPFETYANDLGLTSEDYSERIRTIARNKGIPVLDLYQCGIDMYNMAEMTSDGVHFTPEGMQLVERAMLDGLRSRQ